MIAAKTNTTSVTHGIANAKKPIAWLISSARPTPERDAERRADQRRHDALVPRSSAAPATGVIPTARSIPSSRVRSNTVSTSVLTIPSELTMIDSESST